MLEIKMPHMGVSVHEGTVTAWLKQVGDEVAVDEVVCEVATDKVETDVLAPAAGTLLEIVADVGETVAIGEALARVGEVGEVPAPTTAAPPASAPIAAKAASSTATDPSAQSLAHAGAVRPAAATVPSVPTAATAAKAVPAVAGRVPASVPSAANGFAPDVAAEEVTTRHGRRGAPAASPVARRLAAHHGVELAGVTGSGRNGRVRKADVLASLERQQAQSQASAAPSLARSGGTVAGDGGVPAGYEDVPHEIVRTSHVRRVIAEHMIRSRQTAAHMTTEAYVDMTAVAGVRAELNAERAGRGDAKLSYLPFVVRVACHVLRAFPDLNATFEVDRFIHWREVNVGIAVDTPQGLMVPVIRRCDDLTAAAIGDRIAAIAARARTGELGADDFRGGTFTVSNPGSVGAASAMAIINQPQVAILGLPAILRRPWAVALPDGGEAIVVRPIMKVALTFDHRAIDGAAATRAVVAVRDALQGWSLGDYR